jgi:hypothetical protein
MAKSEGRFEEVKAGGSEPSRFAKAEEEEASLLNSAYGRKRESPDHSLGVVIEHPAPGLVGLGDLLPEPFEYLAGLGPLV